VKRSNILPRCRLFFLFAGALLSLPAITGTVAEAQKKEKLDLAKGLFLVAKPSIGDGTFKEAVVLLLAHDKEDGSLGVIINRPTESTLADALPDLHVAGARSHRLFFGGPVATEALVFVFRTDDPPDEAPHILGDVYFSGNRDVLEKLLEHQTTPRELHVFLGYAGWGPGQLQWEVGRGDWEVVRAGREMIFEKDPELIWPELMGPVSRQVAERLGAGIPFDVPTR
jgi:putative transcriptional regulator